MNRNLNIISLAALLGATPPSDGSPAIPFDAKQLRALAVSQSRGRTSPKKKPKGLGRSQASRKRSRRRRAKQRKS